MQFDHAKRRTKEEKKKKMSRQVLILAKCLVCVRPIDGLTDERIYELLSLNVVPSGMSVVL